MTARHFSGQRRFSRAAWVCVLLGALAGSAITLASARAADAEVTGSLAAKAEGSAWWRLRPAQGPAIEAARNEGTTLPEGRKAVRMVYPAPYPTR